MSTEIDVIADGVQKHVEVGPIQLDRYVVVHHDKPGSTDWRDGEVYTGGLPSDGSTEEIVSMVLDHSPNVVAVEIVARFAGDIKVNGEPVPLCPFGYTRVLPGARVLEPGEEVLLPDGEMAKQPIDVTKYRLVLLRNGETNFYHPKRDLIMPLSKQTE